MFLIAFNKVGWIVRENLIEFPGAKYIIKKDNKQNRNAKICLFKLKKFWIKNLFKKNSINNKKITSNATCSDEHPT
jgi:hypothetical protein